VVAVKKVVVAMAEGLATVAAEFCRCLAATLLMFLQLVRTAKSADVSYLNFLASLDHSVER
jgi:hypothetical protein